VYLYPHPALLTHQLNISEDSKIISTMDTCGPNIAASTWEKIIVSNRTKLLNFSNPSTSLTVSLVDGYNQVVCMGYDNLTVFLRDQQLRDQKQEFLVRGVAKFSGYFVTKPYWPGQTQVWTVTWGEIQALYFLRLPEDCGPLLVTVVRYF
jgi:hypothetical protein